jgi:hypothetical protein
MKAELKKTQHPLNIKVLNASAQVLIVLSQSQNGLFNMECSMDPDADCIINIKQDPVKYFKPTYYSIRMNLDNRF